MADQTPEQTPAQPPAVAASFAEHVRAFHAGLPVEEQALLEQVFALAESVSADDTGGYIFGSLLNLDPTGVAKKPDIFAPRLDRGVRDSWPAGR